jgi:GNAT superfamily N-acetyltransferase
VISPAYRIAAARAADLPQLAAVELAAASLLSGYAPASVLGETTNADVLEKARRQGRLWVLLDGETPVGFAHLEVLEHDTIHLEELDVHPEHGRRGLGTWLVRHVCRWAMLNGYRSMTLTTFREPPWNMPFYQRLGFSVVADHELSGALRAVIEDERRRGLAPSRRVAMRRRFDGHRAAAGAGA